MKKTRIDTRREQLRPLTRQTLSRLRGGSNDTQSMDSETEVIEFLVRTTAPE